MNPIVDKIKNVLFGGTGKFIESADKLIDNLTLSKEEKEQFRVDLIKAQNEHLQAMEQEATKQLEQQVKEMDSARQRELQIAISDKAPTLNKIITPILAIVIIGLTFILFYLIMFRGVNGVEKDILVFVLGALTGYVGMVLSYYFGSSIGSAHKQSQIEKMIK